MNKETWEVAYEKLKGLILNTELTPGEILYETKLAKEFGMSRTPVREALNKLEQEGLVISENNRKKVFVLTIKDIKEIFDIKKSLEGDMVSLAIERGKEEEFEKLAEIIKEMGSISTRKPKNSKEIDRWAVEWFEKDKQLHDIIFEMARNERARQIIENLNNQWHRLRVGMLTIEGRIERSTQEHNKIVQAILKRSPAEAKLAMIEHLENLQKNLIRLMELFHFPSL